MKFPPASRKASYTLRPPPPPQPHPHPPPHPPPPPQPHSSPKVMVSSAASETRRPELPRSRYCIEISFFRWEASLWFWTRSRPTFNEKSLVLATIGVTSRIRQCTCRTRHVSGTPLG